VTLGSKSVSSDLGVGGQSIVTSGQRSVPSELEVRGQSLVTLRSEFSP